MREARRPTAAYGIRVQRRLRGRWFSLVPVRRATLITMSAAIAGVSLLLCFLHYASVAWPSIAYRPEIARPLRLDRPDSFGRLYACGLLAGSAGISLLTYQLRRYRIEDYQGRYRLWRLVLVVLVLASVNSLVSIIQWGGALLDVGFGRRVALTGSDWLRLVVSIGGAIIALRLCAEVRRCRWALVSMIAACGLLAIPEAAKWNFIGVETITAWTVVTSAPLLAFTMLFISLTGYLRMLYREVRQIEDGDSLAERVNQFRQRMLRRAAADDEDQSQDGRSEATTTRPTRSTGEPKRGWFRRRNGREAAKQEAANQADQNKSSQRSAEQPKAKQPPAPSRQPDSDSARSRPSPAEGHDQPDKGSPRRRWFGLRRAKADSTDAKSSSKASDRKSASGEKSAGGNREATQKRSRFSLRLAPSSRAAKAEGSETKQQDARQGDTDPGETPTKRGLGRWLPTKKAVASDDSQRDSDAKPAPAATADDHQEGDIDWDTLSKSERRRLRKQLRRQGGRAA